MPVFCIFVLLTLSISHLDFKSVIFLNWELFTGRGIAMKIVVRLFISYITYYTNDNVMFVFIVGFKGSLCCNAMKMKCSYTYTTSQLLMYKIYRCSTSLTEG